MNVSLTEELERFVDGKVESGLYNNASQVVREGLRLLKEHDEFRARVRESTPRPKPSSYVVRPNSVASQLARKHQVGIRTSLNSANMLMALALRVWQVPASFTFPRESAAIRTATA